MDSVTGLFCRLTKEAFRKRKKVLKSSVFNHLEQIEEIENGFVFKFKEEGDFDKKLMELIVAERACCPFFEIKLHLLPYKKGISMEISGQEGVKEFLKTELLD